MAMTGQAMSGQADDEGSVWLLADTPATQFADLQGVGMQGIRRR